MSQLDLTHTWEMQPEIHSGYLTKQGGIYKTWKKRWFSVRGHTILYFKEKEDQRAKPLGVITLAYPLDKEGVLTREVCEVPKPGPDEQHSAREHGFIIKGKQESQRTFYLCAPTADEMKTWIDVISRVIYSPKGGGMFGCDLAEQLLKEQRGPDTVPRLVEDCVQHLKTFGGIEEDGLFRIAARSIEVEELRSKFMMATWPKLTAKDDAHVVANTLKKYLLQLPSPLLTADKFDLVIAAAGVYKKNPDEGLKVLQDLVRDVDFANGRLLKYVCGFLTEVAAKVDVNQMTVKNLAVVFAPSFMRTPPDAPDSLILSTLADIRLITEVLIERHAEIFTMLRPTEDADWEPFRAKEREEEELALLDFDPDDTVDSDGGGSGGGSHYGSGGGGGPHGASAMALVMLAEKKPPRPPQPTAEEMEMVVKYLQDLPPAPNSIAKAKGSLVPQEGTSAAAVRQLQTTLVRERQLRSALVVQLQTLNGGAGGGADTPLLAMSPRSPSSTAASAASSPGSFGASYLAASSPAEAMMTAEFWNSPTIADLGGESSTDAPFPGASSAASAEAVVVKRRPSSNQIRARGGRNAARGGTGTSTIAPTPEAPSGGGGDEVETRPNRSSSVSNPFAPDANIRMSTAIDFSVVLDAPPAASPAPAAKTAPPKPKKPPVPVPTNASSQSPIGGKKVANPFTKPAGNRKSPGSSNPKKPPRPSKLPT